MQQKVLQLRNRTFTCRYLRSIADFEQVQRVQKESWGLKDIDVMPIHFMLACKDWSIQTGIFEAEKLVSLALIYPTGDKADFLLHMLCTLPEYRNMGLGKELMKYDIDLLQVRQARTLCWTFDPFDFTNAHLYLNVVKATGFKAEMNYYGALDSKVHTGLPSHRLFCRLNIGENEGLNYTSEKTLPLVFDSNSLRTIERSKAIDYMNAVFLQIRENVSHKFVVTGFVLDKTNHSGTLIFKK